jgi:polyhydroxybutyrate depolymerase
VIRILFALSAILLVFAWACGGGGGSATGSPAAVSDPSPPADGGCGQPLAHASGNFDETISSGGLERTYSLHVPAGYDATKRTPLVLSFHGFSLNAKFFASYADFDAVADKAGFIVVTPDATGTPSFWNEQAVPGATDDVAFVRDLLAKLDGQLCIDADRTYAAGYSNGGGMALRAACDLPDRIAAVGVVAALYVNCRAAVPLIAFHGTSDPIVPFEGGDNPLAGGGIFPSVRRSVSEWARELGCDGLPLISRPSSEVELSTFQKCSSGEKDALLYTVLGGGHTWPGAMALPETIVGMTTQQVNATPLIWEFFAAHPHGH